MEIIDISEALKCIEPKDWYRARTVNKNQIDMMLKAINEPRKLIGRLLAIYFYNKYALKNAYIDEVPQNSFLRDWFSRLDIDNDITEEIIDLPLDELKPYVMDKETYRKIFKNNNLFEIDESFDALTSLETSLLNFLDSEDLNPEELFFIEDNGNLRLNITVAGDWKHDHAATDYMVDQFCNDNALEILDSNTVLLDDSTNDSYRALHSWLLDDVNNIAHLHEEFCESLSEDISLEETYSDEELNDMIGKTYNQQKILNIYRRQKYNDKRLFAHTKCTKCGREKRVFLSNLVNDPDKYGSCICSDTNVESRLDNIEDLYDGSKKLSSNTSGFTGVTHIATSKGKLYNKWRAYIEIDGKRTYLGDFDSKSAAVRARKKAAEKGLKWYQEHKNEFMKNYRKKSKRYRSLRHGRSKIKKIK